jgi:putative hemolysin
MTFLFHKGRYTAPLAQGGCDLHLCQQLRHRCFFGADGVDHDLFDADCDHLIVTDVTGRVVATARLYNMQSGASVCTSYAALFNDLYGFYELDAPLIEIGRFCIAPDVLDADVLCLAWGALTQIVDQNEVAYLFGCTSFAGTDPTRYGRAFARLQAQHLGTAPLCPLALTNCVIPLADVPPNWADPMPLLLRTYLAMGGWVSDYAVIDHKMNTLHVFTCLEVASVPPSRAAALRALAEGTRLS